MKVMSAGPSPAREVSSRPGVRSSALSEKWGFALALLLIVATVVLYRPVKYYPFITYDDPEYVIRNYQIQSGPDWDMAQWAFTTFYASNWHPLTWMSHALDFKLFRLNPSRHHDTSVLFHALNAALLFWVLWRATGYAGRSFMVAALFALHPINVESVAWISERKNVLSMFFFLLALGAYRWYALRPRTGRYLAVAFLYALGLMAKPQVITFPCVLLLWDYWPLRRMFAPPAGAAIGTAQGAVVPAKSFVWLLMEKLPLFALSAADAMLTVKAQGSTGAINNVINAYPFPIRLENAIVSCAKYMGKAIWPSNLAIYYPHPESWINPLQVASAAILLLAITALVIAGRRWRYFLVGWYWFLGTLVPMIGLVQVGGQGMADRYAYLPFIGLFIMVCWGVTDFQPAAWKEEGQTSSAWLAVASLAVVVALMAVAHRQLRYWRNSEALWTHAVEVTRGNWMAEDYLAGVMMEVGKPDQALAHFYRALAINPNDPVSNTNIGSWKLYVGKPQEAIAYYQNVLRSSHAPSILKAQATEGLNRAYRAIGSGDASGEGSSSNKSSERD
jgi:protein O-mannosyl-transferase